jgi:hypothetical protein
MATNYTFNFWLSLFFFVAHIAGNFMVAKRNPALEAMLQKYTFSPPFWVFGIWFVIWTLQGILFYKTAGSQFWSNSLTILFILTCIGNVGSQIAGFNNWSGFVYISFIICMMVCSILFMENASPFISSFTIVKSATQLYVGWATLAFVVAVGAVLVAEHEIISNRNYSLIGYTLLAVVPTLIWAVWLINKTDYRIVSIPYFLVIFAFALRLILR